MSILIGSPKSNRITIGWSALGISPYENSYELFKKECLENKNFYKKYTRETIKWKIRILDKESEIDFSKGRGQALIMEN